jgi:integrase/recombinase XerC
VINKPIAKRHNISDTDAVDLWLEARATRSPGTFDQYRRASGRLLRWCHENSTTLNALKVSDAMRFLSFLERPTSGWIKDRTSVRTENDLAHLGMYAGLSKKSVKLTRTIIIQMFSYLLEAGYVRANVFKLTPVDGGATSNDVTRWINVKSMDWLLQWLNSCPDNNNEMQRARFIIQFLYHTGIRRSEMVALKFRDVVIKDDHAFVRVLGKRQKIRMVTLNSCAISAFNAYKTCMAKIHGKNSPLLFSLENNDAPITGRHLAKIVQDTLAAAAADCQDQEIKMQLVVATPHWFRHTMATHRLMAGASIETTQDELGHANINTTRIYAKTTSVMRAADAQKHADLLPPVAQT